MSIASDWQDSRNQSHISNQTVFEEISSIIETLSTSITLAERRHDYKVNVRMNGTTPVRLTQGQTEVLQTFIENSQASNRSVAKMYEVIPESISSNLKDVSKQFNRPGASRHALATIAKAHGLIWLHPSQFGLTYLPL